MPLGFCLWLQRILKQGGGSSTPSDATNTVRPSISGSGHVGDSQTGSGGSWTSAVAYEYRFQFNGITVTTGTSYTPSSEGNLIFQTRGQDSNGVWSPWVTSLPMTITKPAASRAFSSGFSLGFR